MNSKIVGLLAVSTLTASMSALGASETLTYSSAPFTSAYAVDSSSPAAVAVNSYFTATLTLSTPLGDNFSGSASNDVTSLVFTTHTGATTNSIVVTPTEAVGSSFDFSTNSTGAITGWDFTAGIVSNGSTQLPSTSDVLFHSCSNYGCAAGSYNGQGYGVTGDWYDYLPGSSTASDGCTYSAPTSCGSKSGAVGSWTVGVAQAPELDPASATAGLTLVIGGFMVLRGRRRATKLEAAGSMI